MNLYAKNQIFYNFILYAKKPVLSFLLFGVNDPAGVDLHILKSGKKFIS